MGLAPITLQAELLTTDTIEVTPATLTLAPNESARLELRAKASAMPRPGLIENVLILTTDIPGDIPRTLPVSMLRGAVVTLPRRVVVPSTPVGLFRLGAALGTEVEGNAPVGLVFDDDADDPLDEVSYTQPIAGARLGLGRRSYALTYAPATPGARRIKVHVTNDDSAGYLCAPISPSTFDVELRAEGVAVEVSPTLLELGDTRCGETAPGATFSLRNLTTAAQSFTIGSGWGRLGLHDVSPASGSIPAGGEVTATVTPRAVGRDYRPETTPVDGFVVDLSERLSPWWLGGDAG